MKFIVLKDYNFSLDGSNQKEFKKDDIIDAIGNQISHLKLNGTEFCEVFNEAKVKEEKKKKKK